MPIKGLEKGDGVWGRGKEPFLKIGLTLSKPSQKGFSSSPSTDPYWEQSVKKMPYWKRGVIVSTVRILKNVIFPMKKVRIL